MAFPMTDDYRKIEAWSFRADLKVLRAGGLGRTIILAEYAEDIHQMDDFESAIDAYQACRSFIITNCAEALDEFDRLVPKPNESDFSGTKARHGHL
jgi:hypothetical protein